MNEYQVCDLISSSLTRSRVDLGRAVGELRAIVKDEDARDNMPGLLHSWSRYVLGEVSEEDRARLASYSVLNARQEWALQYARSRGRVVVGDMRRRWPSFSHETLRLDLADLVRRGHLAPKGERRGRIYQPVGNTLQASGNAEKGVSEGAVGASDDTPVDLKPLPEADSQQVGNMGGRPDLAVLVHKVLRIIGRNGARWIDAGNGRQCDGCRSAGCWWSMPNGAVKFELDVVPELRARVATLGEVLSFELGRVVEVIHQDDGRVFVVVGGAK